jgi:hypothetical protein
MSKEAEGVGPSPENIGRPHPQPRYKPAGQLPDEIRTHCHVFLDTKNCEWGDMNLRCLY